jgi:hypothetical protein
MRPATAAALAAIVLPGLAIAAPPAPPAAPPVPPKLFAAAGYSEPEIGGAACKAVNASETQCAVPAMTAGRYLVKVAATSTAQAPDAAQQLSIVAGDQVCTATRSPRVETPWAVGAKRTFYAACLFTILTDNPIAITAVYIDAKATKDPAGPQITVIRQPWSGALAGAPVAVNQ